MPKAPNPPGRVLVFTASADSPAVYYTAEDIAAEWSQCAYLCRHSAHVMQHPDLGLSSEVKAAADAMTPLLAEVDRLALDLMRALSDAQRPTVSRLGGIRLSPPHPKDPNANR